MTKSSIDLWLQTGVKVQLGGRVLIMLPLPLSKLKKVLEVFPTKLTEAIASAQSPDRIESIATLVNVFLASLDPTELVYDLFTFAKDPDSGESINKGLTREFIEEHLDIPTSRKIISEFIKLNELEEVAKNLQSLPGMKEAMEALTATIGLDYLSSLRQSMGSLRERSGNSRSPKSTDTSVAGQTSTKSQKQPGTGMQQANPQ